MANGILTGINFRILHSRRKRRCNGNPILAIEKVDIYTLMNLTMNCYQKAKPTLVTQHRLLRSKCLEDTNDLCGSHHPVIVAASRGFTYWQPESPTFGYQLFDASKIS